MLDARVGAAPGVVLIRRPGVAHRAVPLLAGLALAASSCAPGGAARDEVVRVDGRNDGATARLVGSERCVPCHAQAAGEWKGSQHANSVRAASIGDEERLASLIPCSDMDVTHVLGERHVVRFLVERPGIAWGEGRWLALPCAWDVHQKALQLHHPEDWRGRAFESTCAPCHVTRQAPDWSFSEIGVGCEACHGTGSRHVDAPSQEHVFGFRGSAAQEVTTCGSCHLQGGVSRRTGRSFPDGYTPGDALLDDYEFNWSSLDRADPKEAIDVHQKLLVRSIVVDGDASLRCTSCHELHGMTHEKHRALPRQDYCLTCHQPETYALKEYRQSCPVCEF